MVVRMGNEYVYMYVRWWSEVQRDSVDEETKVTATRVVVKVRWGAVERDINT